MAQYVPINQATDVITDTTKVTTGYFTGGVGSLAKDNLTTASLSTTQKKYYYNLQHSSEDRLSVTYGHFAGSGSAACDETRAIYKQFMNLLLDPSDLATGSKQGFIFEGTHPTSGAIDNGFSNTAGDGPAGTATFEDDMYFIVAERARMKDRLNKENWTLTLSGSKDLVVDGANHAITGSSLVLTDDSKIQSPTATPVGPRYNVISGSSGNTTNTLSSSKFYGYYYPNVGIIALRGHMLSASAHGLNGTPGYVDSASFMEDAAIGQGLTRDLTTDGGADNALKLVNAIHMGAQTFRSEEDQTSKAYFCRALANDFNFSNNPTFVSGSNKALRNQDMVGYPHTFITTVGLYQTTGGTTIGGGGSQELVAVGRLSSPVQKNYGTEATIKVKFK